MESKSAVESRGRQAEEPERLKLKDGPLPSHLVFQTRDVRRMMQPVPGI
jgi:hypothetical protein